MILLNALIYEEKNPTKKVKKHLLHCFYFELSN